MKYAIPLISLSTALLAACANDGLGPQSGSLRLEASIGRSTIPLGDTTSLVFRLRNLSSDSIVLNFSNSCQILLYITTRRGDQVVHPSGGEWGCYEVITSFTLAPGAERVATVLLRGGVQAIYPAVPLLPGQYLGYARLANPEFALRSATVAFRVE